MSVQVSAHVRNAVPNAAVRRVQLLVSHATAIARQPNAKPCGGCLVGFLAHGCLR